jgi:hypothetical protein
MGSRVRFFFSRDQLMFARFKASVTYRSSSWQHPGRYGVFRRGHRGGELTGTRSIR